MTCASSFGGWGPHNGISCPSALAELLSASAARDVSGDDDARCRLRLSAWREQGLRESALPPQGAQADGGSMTIATLAAEHDIAILLAEAGGFGLLAGGAIMGVGAWVTRRWRR